MKGGSSSVQEIKERLNIVDIIQEYVPLKLAGSNYKARCPFHQEKTPSFVVSNERQSWHCFGACGEGGDMFSFIQKIEGIDFPEALRLLASKAGVVIERIDPKLITQRTRILDILTQASLFFESQLFETPSGKSALEYLSRRGLSKDTIQSFRLGYANKSWDGLLSFYSSQGFSPKEVELAGLAIAKESGRGWYDRFRDRLMFPIEDIHGTVIGFGGRTRNEQGSVEAKYINTPQTMVYDKSRCLFGLSKAKSAIRQSKIAILVEGYMDVITAHQAGFQNTIAISGTALTAGHIELVKRYAKTLIFAFDTDDAGRRAIGRSIPVALQSEFVVKIANLDHEQGKDPDEIIRGSKDAFVKGIADAKLFLDYYFDRIVKHVDRTNILHKKRASQLILSVLRYCPDPIERSHYIQKLAQSINVREDDLFETMTRLQTLPRFRRSTTTSGEQKVEYGKTKDRREMISEQIFGLALMKRPFVPFLIQSLESKDFPTTPLKTLAENLCILYTANRDFTLDELKESLYDKGFDRQQQEAVLVDRLLVYAQDHFSHLTIDEQERELQRLITILKKENIKSALKEISIALTGAEKNNDIGQVNHLTKEFEFLTETLTQLEQ